MQRYKSNRYINGKVRTVIVENETVINRNPTKEELRGLEKEPHKRKRSKIYTNKELLEFMIQFYQENGRAPTADNFRYDPKYPSPNTYQKYFGNWNKALGLARLTPREEGGTQLYTDEELLEFMIQFYEENGKPPTAREFDNNSKYPVSRTYQLRFGSWENSLRLVGLDVDSMVRKGILETNQQKARLFELYVKEHFKEEPIDLSGKNCLSPIDGICPKGQIYDAKSSPLRDGRYWSFRLEKRGIDFYYLGAFDKDYKKLLHVWRISGDFIDGNTLNIGINNDYRGLNVEYMRKYEITEKFDIENIEKNIFDCEKINLNLK